MSPPSGLNLWHSSVTLNLVGTWVLHIAFIRWTSDISFMKILQAVSEIWRGQEKQAQTWPSSLTLTLNRYGRHMDSARRLREMNMWHKFNENPSSRSGDMERTRKTGSNLWPSSLTLTLNRYGWHMGSARRLCEVKHVTQVSWKSLKQFQRYGADTKNRLKPMTFKPDLDLQPVWSAHGFCTLPPWGEHVTQVSWKSLKPFWRYGADTKNRLKPMTFKPDLDIEPVWSAHRFCMSPPRGEHVTQISWKSLKLFQRFGADTKNRLKPMTFKPDLDLEPVWPAHGFCMSPPWGEHVTQVSWKSLKPFRIYGAARFYGETDRQMDRRTDRQNPGQKQYISPVYRGRHKYL